MRISDLVIIAICGALGFGIVRNILGPSRRPDDGDDRPADSED